MEKERKPIIVVRTGTLDAPASPSDLEEMRKKILRDLNNSEEKEKYTVIVIDQDTDISLM